MASARAFGSRHPALALTSGRAALLSVTCRPWDNRSFIPGSGWRRQMQQTSTDSRSCRPRWPHPSVRRAVRPWSGKRLTAPSRSATATRSTCQESCWPCSRRPRLPQAARSSRLPLPAAGCNRSRSGDRHGLPRNRPDAGLDRELTSRRNHGDIREPLPHSGHGRRESYIISELFHITIAPDGTVRVEVDNFASTC